MPRLPLALLVLTLAGCACTAPRATAPPPPVATSTPATTCAPPLGRDPFDGWCALPDDVRTYVDDRDACDHFRGEPWPETDSTADRARRREILDGLRTACAGTDARLAALKHLHADDARAMSVLADYDERVE
ncbi:hypothetical protein [Lysobacter xanthus]